MQRANPRRRPRVPLNTLSLARTTAITTTTASSEVAHQASKILCVRVAICTVLKDIVKLRFPERYSKAP
jgi:hypothetical protein